jgi:lysophospholipase L1-like esterase
MEKPFDDRLLVQYDDLISSCLTTKPGDYMKPFRPQELALRIAPLSFAVVLCTAVMSVEAAGQLRADQPTPRTDVNSILAHEQLLAKRTQGKIDVYYIGDSITRRWGATDYPELLAHWRANFFGWNAANFGWGADRTEHMLWRLENGELEGVNPKIIVIAGGTNNVGSRPGGPEKVEDIANGIRAIVDRSREKAPDAVIVLMGIFPRNIEVMPEIDRINDNMSRFADGRTIRFVNVNDKLADSDGRLYEGMTVDGLHLSVQGYQIWADALKPIFTEILGPPAATDEAPPPTGDPSASNQ